MKFLQVRIHVQLMYHRDCILLGFGWSTWCTSACSLEERGERSDFDKGFSYTFILVIGGEYATDSITIKGFTSFFLSVIIGLIVIGKR